MDDLYSVLAGRGRIDGLEAYHALMMSPPLARRLALETVDPVTIERCENAWREFMLIERRVVPAGAL